MSKQKRKNVQDEVKDNHTAVNSCLMLAQRVSDSPPFTNNSPIMPNELMVYHFERIRGFLLADRIMYLTKSQFYHFFDMQLVVVWSYRFLHHEHVDQLNAQVSL
jgi:hypothetical protein